MAVSVMRDLQPSLVPQPPPLWLSGLLLLREEEVLNNFLASLRHIAVLFLPGLAGDQCLQFVCNHSEPFQKVSSFLGTARQTYHQLQLSSDRHELGWVNHSQLCWLPHSGNCFAAAASWTPHYRCGVQRICTLHVQVWTQVGLHLWRGSCASG